MSFQIRRVASFVFNLFFLCICYLCVIAVFFLFMLAIYLINIESMFSLSKKVFTVFNMLSPLIILLFFSYMSSDKRILPGNRVMKFKIVTLEGGSLSFRQALLRNLFYVVSVLPLGLGLLCALFNTKRKTKGFRL